MIQQHLKFYFNNPLLWDSIRRDEIAAEVDFVDKLFKLETSIHRVLDVGSGSGIHLYQLSKLGYECTGVDLNQEMIRHARNVYPDIEFYEQDMRNLDIPKTFDAIICLCTVFSYNRSNEEIDRTLRNFYNLLRPGGLLIIDNINPIKFIQDHSFQEEIIELYPYDESGVKSTAIHKIDNASQILEEKRTIENIQSGDIVQSDTTLFRLFFPQEFKYILNGNGFTEVKLYSSFSLIDDPELKGWRLISVARKKLDNL